MINVTVILSLYNYKSFKIRINLRSRGSVLWHRQPLSPPKIMKRQWQEQRLCPHKHVTLSTLIATLSFQFLTRGGSIKRDRKAPGLAWVINNVSSSEADVEKSQRVQWVMDLGPVICVWQTVAIILLPWDFTPATWATKAILITLGGKGGRRFLL